MSITIEQYLALSALAYKNTIFKRIARELYNYAINSRVAKNRDLENRKYAQEKTK